MVLLKLKKREKLGVIGAAMLTRLLDVPEVFRVGEQTVPLAPPV